MKLKSGWFNTILTAVMLLVMLAVIAQAETKEKKESVSPSKLPAAISKAIKQAFPKGQIMKIEKEVEGENPGQYDIDISSDGKEYEVEISPEGKVIETKEKKPAEKTAGCEHDKKWTKSFGEENCEFSSLGKNRFFILQPGHQLILESREEKVVITVLDETKKIGDIETRIVEEREEENGQLKEVSRNFFAICKKHGDVFYFGEEVDDYKDGKIVKHSGQWRADQKDSQAGIIMPGTILLGARHYQEIAPNAMDRAEIIADNVTLETPAGKFSNCLKVEETSGVNAGEKCYKIYAPSVGIIQDEDLLLTGYTKAKEKNIALEDLPPAVRATIEKYAAGGKITEIEKETTIAYEAEVVLDGKELDILVSAEGKYLGTEEEKDSNDQDKKGDNAKDEDDDDNKDD